MLDQSNPTAIAELAPSLPSGQWTVDPEASRAEFAVKHLWGLVTVAGRFATMSGGLEVDQAGRASGRLRIDVTSVETGIRRRDKHLRSGAWLAAAQQRELTFAADAIESIPLIQDTVRIDGTLTIAVHGEPVRLTASVEATDQLMSLSTSMTLDRRAFAMNWGPLKITSDDVAVTVSVCLRRDG